jgi:hypothetical protein
VRDPGAPPESGWLPVQCSVCSCGWGNAVAAHLEGVRSAPQRQLPVAEHPAPSARCPAGSEQRTVSGWQVPTGQGPADSCGQLCAASQHLVVRLPALHPQTPAPRTTVAAPSASPGRWETARSHQTPTAALPTAWPTPTSRLSVGPCARPWLLQRPPAALRNHLPMPRCAARCCHTLGPAPGRMRSSLPPLTLPLPPAPLRMPQCAHPFLTPPPPPTHPPTPHPQAPTRTWASSRAAARAATCPPTTWCAAAGAHGLGPALCPALAPPPLGASPFGFGGSPAPCLGHLCADGGISCPAGARVTARSNERAGAEAYSIVNAARLLGGLSALLLPLPLPPLQVGIGGLYYRDMRTFCFDSQCSASGALTVVLRLTGEECGVDVCGRWGWGGGGGEAPRRAQPAICWPAVHALVSVPCPPAEFAGARTPSAPAPSTPRVPPPPAPAPPPPPPTPLPPTPMPPADRTAQVPCPTGSTIDLADLYPDNFRQGVIKCPDSSAVCATLGCAGGWQRGRRSGLPGRMPKYALGRRQRPPPAPSCPAWPAAVHTGGEAGAGSSSPAPHLLPCAAQTATSSTAPALRAAVSASPSTPVREQRSSQAPAPLGPAGRCTCCRAYYC